MQVQTVRGKIVSQRDLRWTQCKKEMNSRIHARVSLKKKKEGKVNRSQVVVARLCRSFCSAEAKCLLAHAHMQVREEDKLKVIRFPWSSTVVTTPTSTSVTSADVNTVFSGFAVHLHSRSLPVKDSKHIVAKNFNCLRVISFGNGLCFVFFVLADVLHQNHDGRLVTSACYPPLSYVL